MDKEAKDMVMLLLGMGAALQPDEIDVYEAKLQPFYAILGDFPLYFQRPNVLTQFLIPGGANSTKSAAKVWINIKFVTSTSFYLLD